MANVARGQQVGVEREDGTNAPNSECFTTGSIVSRHEYSPRKGWPDYAPLGSRTMPRRKMEAKCEGNEGGNAWCGQGRADQSM